MTADPPRWWHNINPPPPSPGGPVPSHTVGRPGTSEAESAEFRAFQGRWLEMLADAEEKLTNGYYDTWLKLVHTRALWERDKLLGGAP